MGFTTRDRYRHVVEEIAKKSGIAEDEVARLAIGLANEAAAGTEGDNRARHVGYCLIDRALPQLKARAGIRSSVADTVRGIGRRFSLPLYPGLDSLALRSFLPPLCSQRQVPTACAVRYCGSPGAFSLLSVSSFAIALVNLFTTRLVTPHPLPRMDFSKGSLLNRRLWW